MDEHRRTSTELFLAGDYAAAQALNGWAAEEPGPAARIHRVCCETPSSPLCTRCGQAGAVSFGSQYSCGNCGAVWQA